MRGARSDERRVCGAPCGRIVEGESGRAARAPRRGRNGRAASPLAAGNRNVQADVMGDADAIQPESGETCVRTFPAPSCGMRDTGGQGLPALPILAHGKSQGFHLTTPLGRFRPAHHGVVLVGLKKKWYWASYMSFLFFCADFPSPSPLRLRDSARAFPLFSRPLRGRDDSEWMRREGASNCPANRNS